ncbi:MAG: hypothetical protein Q9200_006991 [Gallowayella weberi]
MVYISGPSLFATLLSLCPTTISLLLPPSSLPQAPALLNTSYLNQLAGPVAPPGFEMTFFVEQGHTYDPTNFYISAVEAMYNLSKRDYEAAVRVGQSEVVRGIQFCYFEKQQQQGRRTALRNKHVVLAILATLSQMDKEDDFGPALVEMSQYKEVFGLMRILAQDSPGPERPRSTQATDVGKNITTAERDGDPTTKGPITADNMNSTNLTFSQSIIDPEDPTLIIEYERYGEAFACKTLLGASLDALASLAPLDRRNTIFLFQGTVWSKQVAYRTFSVWEESERRFLLTFAMIRRAMLLLPMRIVEGQGCGEVNFRILHGGEPKGHGSFFIPSVPNKKES